MKTLYSIQETHVKRLEAIIRKHRAALDSSETGCGKTVCAVELARRLAPPKVVVLCPKAVIPSWRKELAERGVEATVINYEKVRRGVPGLSEWTKVYRREKFRWLLPPDSLLIFDEAHKCGGETSQNAEMLIQAKEFQVLLLSATLASSPTNLRAPGYVLGLHELRNYRGFAKQHGCRENPFNKLEYKGGPEGLVELGKALNPFTDRLTVADMADHFTETQIITEPLEFGDDIKRLYAEMEQALGGVEAQIAQLTEESKALESQIETLERSVLESDKRRLAKARAQWRGKKLVEQTRFRQKVELLKVPVIVELVSAALEEGKSVAVFVNFQQSLDALVAKFKADAIHGQQTAEQRQAAITRFQNDVSRVIVCNTAAGGVGVSLHDVSGKHPRLAIISPDWNEKAVVQTLGRVHRAGGKTPSQQRILFAAGTVEEEVERSLRRKIDNLNRINLESMIEYTEDEPIKAPNAVLSLGADGMKLETQPPAPAADATLADPVPTLAATLAEPAPTLAPTQAQPDSAPDSAHPDHGARGHAEHSPSSLKYFEACPSFAKTDGSSAMADIGTRIHEALDAEDLSRLGPEEAPLAEYCLQFRDYIRASKQPATIKRQYKEIRLTVELGEGVSTYGSVDLFETFSDNTGILMDWKTGYNAVDDCEINSQVWAYTLGAFQKFPEIEKIDTYLVLPRRQEVSHFQFTRADMERMALRLGTIILRAKQLKGEVFTPQEGVCDYCGNRARCQALADKALKIGRMASFDVPESVDVVHGKPEDKAKLLKLANLLTSWADDVKKELLRQALEESAEIPGYRLDQRRVPRSIPSPVLAYNALKDFLSLDEFLAAAGKISVTALEEAYSSKAPKGKKSAFKAQLIDTLTDAGAISQDGVIHLLKPIKA